MGSGPQRVETIRRQGHGHAMDTLLSGLARALLHNNLLGLLSGMVALVLFSTTTGRSRGAKALTAGVWLVGATRGVLFLSSSESWDFPVFHACGVAFWAGKDVYADVFMQNPPTAIPLFAAFALAPLRVSAAIWYALNLVGLFAILAVAKRVLATLLPGSISPGWSSEAPVTVAVVLSVASTWGLDAGQVSVWTTLWILLALLALANRRDTSAGLYLAPATVKVATVLPFLIPAFAWRRWRTWAGLGAGILALSLAWPSAILSMVRSEFRNIAAARAPGLINDYSFAGPFHDDMLGLEHWLYCLGFRDPSLIATLQLLTLAFVAALLAWSFHRRRRPADVALLFVLSCTLACLFLYHRLYDAIILALPLLYCVAGARRSDGFRRLAYLMVAIGLVLVMDFPRGWRMSNLAEWTLTAGAAGRLVQVFVLPYAVWLLMASAAALAALGAEPRGSKEGSRA